jgi:peptidoglycan/xylan/chitin deacetylase (PgdA/CDA1 family)
MTRFHTTTILALILALVGIVGHQFFLVAAAGLAWLGLMALGVTIPQWRWFGDFICQGSPHKRQVALTFDDGPDARSTPALLDLLRDRKIPAAFFGLGKNAAAHPEITARIVREGHLLENHSQTHSPFINFYSTARLQGELTAAQAAITRSTGVAPRFYRPPVGLSNPHTFRVARNLNLRVIGWTVRSLDTVMAEPEKIVARVRRGLRPGAIVLLHDGGIPPEKLLATVKSLLDTLRELGYEVVRLDELLK